jgi:hypothetical protein
MEQDHRRSPAALEIVEAHAIHRDELSDWRVPALGRSRREVNSKCKSGREQSCQHPKVLIH